MRCAAAVAAGLVALVAAGCGGDDNRDDVKAYVEQANEVQRRSAADFAAANQVYEAFARGALEGPGATERVAEVERSIRAVRDDVERIDAPDRAVPLHRKLLRLYDVYGELAHETAVLARYPGAARGALRRLGPAQRRLARRLGIATTPATQADAFRDYAETLAGAADKLAKVDAPELLAQSRDRQVERLRAAGRLAVRLRRAVGDGDSQTTARLLLRFRKLGRPDGSGAIPAPALRGYSERLRELAQAEADVRAERARLDRSLG